MATGCPICGQLSGHSIHCPDHPEHVKFKMPNTYHFRSELPGKPKEPSRQAARRHVKLPKRLGRG